MEDYTSAILYNTRSQTVQKVKKYKLHGERTQSRSSTTTFTATMKMTRKNKNKNKIKAASLDALLGSRFFNPQCLIIGSGSFVLSLTLHEVETY